MNAHDLIFSSKPFHRISRHVLFWMAWWIYFSLTYHIPNFWFINWEIDQSQLAQMQQMGYGRFVQFTLLNNFLGAISNHLFFTYPLLYFLMPRYLYTGRYMALGIGLVVLTLLTIVFTYYKFQLYYNPLMVHFGFPPNEESDAYIFYCIWTQVLFNSPTVGGIAAGLKLFKHYYLKEKETAQVAKEKARAELQLLKSQVHPHFLFNTLNNIYYFTLSHMDKASGMIRKLSGLLYYMLYECNRALVPLDRELKMITDYLSLEKIRYSDRLDMKLKIEGDPSRKWVVPLLLIPFLENSFKHGVSKMLERPWIDLHISIKENLLLFRLKNSKPDKQEIAAYGGIGLANIKKRLQLLYPGKSVLVISEDQLSYSVSLRIELFEKTAEELVSTDSILSYELA